MPFVRDVEASLLNPHRKTFRASVSAGASGSALIGGLLFLLLPFPSPAQSAANPESGAGTRGCGACISEVAEFTRIPPLDASVWPALELAQVGTAADQVQPQPDPGGNPGGSKNATPAKRAQQKGKYAKSANAGSPGHIYWVIPAFHVSYGHFKPLTPKEKFQEWWEGVYDPLGLGVTAIQAGTLEYSSSGGFCDYGSGFANYMKCFGSMELDATDSSFFGDFVFAVWWHQDPRYFRLGHGGFPKRTLYAISRVFVTFNDSGKNVFYSSALAGTGLAAAVSNLYYPQQDRGVDHTLSRVAIDLGDTALYNGAAEFWPDIHGWLHRHH